MDAVITAWGTAGPWGDRPGTDNRAYLVPAGTPQTFVTGRRSNALIRPTNNQNQPAIAEFLDTRGGTLD